MRGRKYYEGLLKGRDGRKIERPKKMVAKNFLGYETKISRGGKFKIRPGRQTPQATPLYSNDTIQLDALWIFPVYTNNNSYTL